MTIINGYITRTEFLNWITPPSQTVAANTADDAVVDSIIEAVSRYIDDKTCRHFYPLIETRYYDVPSGALEFDDDLLALTTLTNGDSTAIASTDYVLHLRNRTPYYKVSIMDTSTVSWEESAAGSSEQVIQVLGTWGYHNQYYQAWEAITIITEDLDISETGIDVASVARLGVGSIYKIDSEVFITSAVGALTNTVMKRGDNGSTAATHTNGATVYLWKPISPIQSACYQICDNLYKKRFGTNVNSVATVTGAGVVLSPKDIPDIAAAILRNYTRIV
jgi:hypothetical protein